MMIYDEHQVNKMLADEREVGKKIKEAGDAELARIAAALELKVPSTVEEILAAIKALRTSHGTA